MSDPPAYFTTWDTLPGRPVLVSDHAPCLGVYDAAGYSGTPVGIAYLAGSVEHHRGPAQVFRLVLKAGGEVEGRYLLEGRRFVRLGDAAEIRRG